MHFIRRASDETRKMSPGFLGHSTEKLTTMRDEVTSLKYPLLSDRVRRWASTHTNQRATKPMRRLRRTGTGRPVDDGEREDLEKILYVEDDDTNWSVAQLSLARNYDLQRAVDARQTFDRLSATQFALVLMDIELAGSELSGIEIVQVLREAPSIRRPNYAAAIELPFSTPIVFVTAYTARYSRQELLSYGADEVLTKPVNFTSLSLTLSRLLTKEIR